MTARELLYAHLKALGVARLRGSHFTLKRGWVWTWGRRDSLADDGYSPRPRKATSSDDTAATVGGMCCSPSPPDVQTSVRFIVASMKLRAAPHRFLSRINTCADPWNAAYAHECVFYACGWQHYIAVVLPTKLLPECPKRHHRAS